MSRDSLFSQHLSLIEKDPSKWTDAEKQEFERLQHLRLPPLPERKHWWNQFQFQIRIGVASALAMSLAVVIFLPSGKEDLTAKGAVQISAFSARGAEVLPLSSANQLVDGDKIGAAVLSSESSVAYWTVADSQFNIIGDPKDFISTQLRLEPGVKKSFDSSFELTAPNQGEHLLIIVCPSKFPQTEASLLELWRARDLVQRALDQNKVAAGECTLGAYRLRVLE